MKITIKIFFIIGILYCFFACEKDNLANLPLSRDDWQRAAPVPNVSGQYDFFGLLTNINKELIAETRPSNASNSSRDENYYYDEDTDGWFLMNSIRSSNGGGASIYTYLNTPAGNLIAVERYSLNNSSVIGSIDSRTAIWNLDNATSPVKLADESIQITTNYYQITTNGDVLSFGFSQGYVATLYDNTNNTIVSIDCSLLGGYNQGFFNNYSFFALGEKFMIRYDDQYYTVNKTTKALELSAIQLSGFAVGDLDVGTGFDHKQTYLKDGTLIAVTNSSKMMEWTPGESQPTIYTFNNPDFNINRNWSFAQTEDDKLVIGSRQMSTLCPDNILYLMEKNGMEYGYRKIVSDYSDCSSLGGCLTTNGKIYGVVSGSGGVRFMVKINFY